jgi:hypothetical protein
MSNLLDMLLALPNLKNDAAAEISPSGTPVPPRPRRSVGNPADEALAVLARLKTLALPAGRMPAAREIAQRCTERLLRRDNGEPVAEADDTAAILSALREIERELIALGATSDPELAEAVDRVTRAFPGSRLVEVRTSLVQHAGGELVEPMSADHIVIAKNNGRRTRLRLPR